MSCGCSPANPAPNSAVWGNQNQLPLVPAVWDPNTGQIRALAFGESFPGYGNGGNACGCGPIYGTLEPTKALQDAYFDLQRRLANLEQKYCECVCGPNSGTPAPPTPGENIFPSSMQFNRKLGS